jgi:adenosylhomocysteine nucleosidase
MGKERAENATRFTLERYPVSAIVSLGFAGGLAPELKFGDVVVCSMLHCGDGLGEAGQGAEPWPPDPTLLSMALKRSERIGAKVRSGTCVTVPLLDSDPQKMRALRDSFEADIVDMESYWIAGVASDRQIPFIAIRSISDTIQRSIQPFDRILASDGTVLWKKAIVGFLLHPQYVMNTVVLFRNTRLAKRNLTAVVHNLVAGT